MKPLLKLPATLNRKKMVYKMDVWILKLDVVSTMN